MINPDTFLLAEISENIKSLQLQLDYEKSRLTTALGGDPVLYDVAGTGAIIGGSAKIGTGSAIAGATLQVDGGDLVVGDGAGGAMAKITSLGKVQSRGVGPLTYYTLNDNAAISLIPTSARGLLLTWSHSVHTINRNLISGIFAYDTATPAISKLAGYPDTLLVELFGTTGVDGNFSVSSYNAKIYLENRLAATAFVCALFISI